LINVDGFLNLPSIRFSEVDPARTFYQHAIRFDELFETLVLPSKADRRVEVEMNFTEETALRYRRNVYRFDDIDVILLEGVYAETRISALYDLSIWIECTFETALEQAIKRGQEGLPPAEVTRAYQTIYFPAQLIHFEVDHPQTRGVYCLPQ